MITHPGPTHTALFLVRNLAVLSSAQVMEMEKLVSLALPAKRIRRQTFREPATVACYGCRILKPIEKMKDADKIADRWRQAWMGSPSGIPGVLTMGDEVWISECQSSWIPFLTNRIHALAEKPSLLDADLFFDSLVPPIQTTKES